MTTRRVAAAVEIPADERQHAKGAPTKSTTTSTKLDYPPQSGSPWFPTYLETALLAIYPATLILGSLFSSLQVSAREATYSAESQSYTPETAPSYFAKKSNVFNVYFVKIGWFWITLAIFSLISTHPSLGPPLRPQLTRRRLQAAIRYLCITAVWIAVTQWFFGPPIIDRSFKWTGGQCEKIYGDTLQDEVERAQMSDAREVLTHAACRAIGGQWKGGHDISGHVFLLILGSAMIWLELLPAVLKMEGLREARRVRTQDGLVRSASVEVEERESARRRGREEQVSIGMQGAVVVLGLSWWMLLMTAAYFHTWFEKFTGLVVAFAAVYAVYFLPRAVPAIRRIVGLPGV